MRRLFGYFSIIGVASLAVSSAYAFSLLGPFDDWQVEQIGYQIGGEIGGPQNLGEEYRWNLPLITYGVTPDFLTYFGQRGSEEIDKAMKILNELPRMSEVDLEEFPTDTRRTNFRAQQLGLRDLKSVAVGAVLEELGLTTPSRYVFTLRTRWTEGDPEITNYFVIKRNFDPVTLEPSSFINGDLWTYTTIIDTDNPDQAFPSNTRVDPLATGSPAVGTLAGIGTFITGLTRDDLGGLRYIYKQMNHNVENIPNGATLSVEGGDEGLFGGGTTAGGGGLQDSPWQVIIPGQTNQTNQVTITGGQGSPWGVVIPGTGQTNQPPPTAGQTNAVGTALRQGIDELMFAKVEYNSTLGQFLPVTNRFTDTVVTNSQVHDQLLQRTLNQPDIVFDAKDLVGGENSDQNATIERADTESWVNNDAVNGTEGDNGPGVVTPPVTITFNKVGPLFFNQREEFLSEGSASQDAIWGSFDGSTNPPIVYPSGTEIEEIERQVTGGQ